MSTEAIPNTGESPNMKAIRLIKIFGKRTVKCIEISHYA